MNQEPVHPAADALPARERADEVHKTRGKLRIFLGYAAGVGKTYGMLDAARQLRDKGIDVVVGYVETHGRAETEALLSGLEVIQCRQVEHRGMWLAEMDLDAILARRPQIVLVDELAHTNAPGSRHPKRYLDVEELLAVGIDVYTTLNVQHVESLNDVIAQITGMRVHETVPDRILDQADEIVSVDLSPDELLQRLRDGKVYVPDQAARTIDKFFRPGNLTALRELALRRTAERVDEQMRAYMQTRSIPGPWPAGERLLVCVSSSALAERLVRAGRRMAARLDAEWFVVHVETPWQARAPEAERDRVARTLRLAEELGAKVVTLPGDDVASTVLQFARRHNVTQIVAGKPLRSRPIKLLRGSFVERLVRRSGAIDVHVISGDQEPEAPVRGDLCEKPPVWGRYLAALALTGAVSVLSVLVGRWMAPTNLVMLYLLAVVVAAVRWGHGPSIMVAVLSVLAFDFLLVPPHLTFAVSDTQYLLTFAGLLVVGLVISTLAARAREQAEAARRRESHTSALYALSRDLATAVGLEQIVRAVVAHCGETFGRETFVLLHRGDQLVSLSPDSGPLLDDDGQAVAAWALRHGQPAGHGTGTLPAAALHCLPLKTAQGVIGVLAIKPPEVSAHLAPEQPRLMEAFASLAALAIERAQLAEEAGRARLLQETEKLQTALLNSISHDLRTPLVSITGALSSLREDEALLDEDARRSLIETAGEEAGRLNRLVSNLLNMTRLEAGVLRIHKEACDLQDVIGASLAHLGDRLGDRQVVVNAETGQTLVPMDMVLIVQVLANLLDNALKYSEPETPIEVQAVVTDTEACISVADRGVGIPSEDLERVFDKFYRVKRSGATRGVGLGLSICKGIVEGHSGRIWAENRPGGGTVVRFTLPLGQSASRAGEEVGL